LTRLVVRRNAGDDLAAASELPRQRMGRFHWGKRAAEMDAELQFAKP
jgi:hypothetical protein